MYEASKEKLEAVEVKLDGAWSSFQDGVLISEVQRGETAQASGSFKGSRMR